MSKKHCNKPNILVKGVKLNHGYRRLWKNKGDQNWNKNQKPFDSLDTPLWVDCFFKTSWPTLDNQGSWIKGTNFLLPCFVWCDSSFKLYSKNMQNRRCCDVWFLPKQDLGLGSTDLTKAKPATGGTGEFPSAQMTTMVFAFSCHVKAIPEARHPTMLELLSLQEVPEVLKLQLFDVGGVSLHHRGERSRFQEDCSSASVAASLLVVNFGFQAAKPFPGNFWKWKTRMFCCISLFFQGNDQVKNVENSVSQYLWIFLRGVLPRSWSHGTDGFLPWFCLTNLPLWKKHRKKSLPQQTHGSLRVCYCQNSRPKLFVGFLCLVKTVKFKPRIPSFWIFWCLFLESKFIPKPISCTTLYAFHVWLFSVDHPWRCDPCFDGPPSIRPASHAFEVRMKPNRHEIHGTWTTTANKTTLGRMFIQKWESFSPLLGYKNPQINLKQLTLSGIFEWTNILEKIKTPTKISI